MAHVGVTEAAKLTGRDPSTIFRALRKGRLSYSKDEAGNRRIDIAELERVFPVEKLAEPPAFNAGNGAIRAPARARTEAPHGEAEAWRQLVAAKDEALRDLRARVGAIEARLDASEAERRQLSERLQGLLTVNRDGVGANPPPAAQNDSQTASHANGNGGNPPLPNDVPAPSASSGLAIPRPPWFRRWFR